MLIKRILNRYEVVCPNYVGYKERRRLRLKIRAELIKFGIQKSSSMNYVSLDEIFDVVGSYFDNQNSLLGYLTHFYYHKDIYDFEVKRNKFGNKTFRYSLDTSEYLNEEFWEWKILMKAGFFKLFETKVDVFPVLNNYFLECERIK